MIKWLNLIAKRRAKIVNDCSNMQVKKIKNKGKRVIFRENDLKMGEKWAKMGKFHKIKNG